LTALRPLWFKGQLDGITGDVLGAAVELLEVLALLLVLVIVKG
jgi:cobalamin synthase